jgi:biopolymer transport protein ExbB
MNSVTIPMAALVMNQTPMELFRHGGIFMWPILMVSFLMITIVIERLIFIIKEGRRRQPAMVEKILETVEAGRIDEAIEIGKKSDDFIARIVVYALSHRADSLGNSFNRISNLELKRFSQGLPVLDTCITAAPLLGLLGTVTGMMNTFGALQGGDIAAAAGQITGGVAEALIATACGLLIAITGLFPFNYLNSRFEEARHEVEDVGNHLEMIFGNTDHGTSK